MSITRTVARGTSRLLVGVIGAKVLDFLFYLLLARQLGVDHFGRYMYALSFTLLFNIVADLGISTAVTREAARAPSRIRRLMREAIGLKLVLALIAIATTTGIAYATHIPQATVILIAVFTLAMLVNSAAMLFESLLKSAGRAGSAGLSLVSQSAAALLVGASLLLAGFGPLGGAIGYLSAAVVHLIAAAIWSRDLWRTEIAPAANEPPPAWSGVKGLVREATPLALSGAFIVVYFRIDSVLLQYFQGERAVGLYGGIYRFFEATVLFSAAYRSVLFPIMARAADGPDGSLGVLCRKSLRLHLMFTIGVAMFFTLQARRILEVVLGAEYAAAAPALAVLMWALPGAFMADTLIHLLAAQRRQKSSARAVGITAAANVVLNLAVIPHFSYMGAAATTVASEVLSFGLMFLAFNRSVPRIDLFAIARAPLAAGAIAAGALLLLRPLDPGGVPGVVLMALFAVSAYVLALVALGALGRQDAELVQELLPAGLKLPALGERRGRP